MRNLRSPSSHQQITAPLRTTFDATMTFLSTLPDKVASELLATHSATLSDVDTSPAGLQEVPAVSRSSRPLGAFNVPGHGLALAGQVIDFDKGAVLWFEHGRQPLLMSSARRVRLTLVRGVPYLEVMMARQPGDPRLADGPELRIPLVDVLGLAAIDENSETVRDAIAYERKSCFFH